MKSREKVGSVLMSFHVFAIHTSVLQAGLAVTSLIEIADLTKWQLAHRRVFATFKCQSIIFTNRTRNRVKNTELCDCNFVVVVVNSVPVVVNSVPVRCQ